MTSECPVNRQSKMWGTSAAIQQGGLQAAHLDAGSLSPLRDAGPDSPHDGLSQIPDGRLRISVRL